MIILRFGLSNISASFNFVTATNTQHTVFIFKHLLFFVLSINRTQISALLVF